MPCAITQLNFNAKYGHYKMVQNYDVIKLAIAIITSLLFYKKMTEQNLQNEAH